MRIVPSILLALGIMVVGGGIFVGYRQIRSHPGEVLGVETTLPFWHDGLLFLGGAQADTIQRLSADRSITAVSEFSAHSVEGIVVAPDQGSAIVDLRTGDYSVLWLYADDSPQPIFLAAVRGRVSHMQYSSNGRYLGFIEEYQDPDGSSSRLSIFDIQKKSIQHLTGFATSFTWVDNPEAVVVVDDANQVWYHEISLAGLAEAPTLLGESVSNAQFLHSGRRIIWLAKRETMGVGLFATDLATGEQHMIADLGAHPDERVLHQIVISPNQNNVVVLVPGSSDSANADLLLVNIQSALSTSIPFTASDVRWESDTTILMQRKTPSGSELWRFDTESQSLESVITEGYNSFAS